ncbi:Mitochondrial inner membrane organizing system component [Dimargaris cristalligena]|uniref:MICOS complex subunit MIC10 n=1 Tax=Dimargaris cristalligena TaxID=215637 RepID=A0A4P9ZZ89_9FUNG|nr:Mitochondrial inner membrane organizing system component [Dimargaris cristalligena]RKP38120.1 hypothetical protein BJ085DRAFT_37919 [Dimargaris cristalligena]|eukprot:RKP38120.1 hypothetical protein BJ085DRAFT_37919 [Dimargaris cristalligena]
MSSTKPATAVPSERVLDDKWDQCVADLLVKAGIGFSAGVVGSVLLFRRRTWPVWAGTGFGIGHAYSECQRQFHPSVAFPPRSSPQ